jgi:TonB-dependent starch-binding outer membrane protein SusC
VSDQVALSEVVVTGYGTQSKREITGAVATIDSKDLLAVPATNLAQAMQGRVAGVVVGNENSPGGGVMVRIRGFGTINDNSPLYVIDGTPTKGDLNSLNLNDIESIQVLKDASAASIYGSRAGNGVVIVTTKKGKMGAPKVTYDAYYGVQRPGKSLDLLNTQQYVDLLWEARTNFRNIGSMVDGVITEPVPLTPSSAQFGTGATPVIPDYIFPSGAFEGDPRVSPANYSKNIDEGGVFGTTKFLITKANKEGTDWMDVIFNPAPIQNHQIGVSGATDAGRYAMSVNYFNQDGIMEYTGFDRYSARVNTEFNISNRVRFGENLQVSYSERIGQPNGNNSESNPISFAYRIQPIIPVYDITGYFAGTKGGDLDNSRNPMADLWRNKDNIEKTGRLFGNVFAEFDILKNLTAKTQFGIDYSTYNFRNYTIRDIESAESRGTNSLTTTNSYEYTWTWYNTLTYNFELNSDNRFNIIVGSEAIKNNYEIFTGSRSRFSLDDLYNRYLDAGNGGTASNTGTGSNWNLASEFAKINYSFASKYLLDVTMRRDRSSRFASEFRTAFFPSISAGWRLSQEGFMTGFDFINDLKIRAGWGKTGNQEIGNYNSFTQFGTDPRTSFYDLNGSRNASLQGYELIQFGNPNAKWETTTSTNIGLDATFLGNKFEVSLDWYVRETSDMLFPVAVQLTHGVAANPFQNIGTMTNKGLDLAMNYNSTAMQGALTFNVGLNFSTYRNNVVKTNGDPDTRYFGFSQRISSMAVTQQGFPISSFFGYTIDGIFNTDEEAQAHPAQFDVVNKNRAGQFKFRDVDNSGRIDAGDQSIIGSPHPDFTYGININVNYKAFGLTLFGQGVQGNQIFNFVRYWTDFPTFGGNRSERMYNDSWRPGKTDAKLPQLNSGDVISSNPSTYYLEDGSYLRMKNIQLSFTLPGQILEKIHGSRAVVYIQGQNLLTATKYTGLDPEINLRNYASGSDRQIGVDEGAYPVAKTILLGVNLTF